MATVDLSRGEALVAAMSQDPARASDRPDLRLIAILAAIGSLGPFAIDTYLPALPSMAVGLETTAEAVQWTIAGYLVGVATFPILLAPLSDSLGRKPVIYGAVAAFAALSAACALAPDIETLIVLRVLQAAAGGTVMTTARAVLADLYRGDALSRAVSILMTIFTLAPVVAPLLGGAVLEVGGWRAIFWALCGIAGMIAVFTLFLRETLAPEKRNPFRPGPAIASYIAIARDRRAHRYLFAAFFSAIFFFAMLSGSPFIFIDHFGLSSLTFAYIFAGISLTALVGNFLNMRLVMRRGYERMLRDASIAIAVLAVAMGIVAATGWGGWIAVTAVMLWIMAAFHVLVANSTAGLMERTDAAGGASAVLALFRFTGGALGAAALGLFDAGAPTGFAAVLGVGALGLLLSLRLGR